MSDGAQQDREEFGTGIGEVRHEPAARRWRLRLYVLALLATPFVLIGGTILWMMLPVYAEHAQYAYIADTGYGMRLKHADCDVVVYGDSTALVGVMPKVIEQRTGLKTCNVAEVAGVQVSSGLMVLDTYLKNNRAPRFIVFNYAPENLNDASQWKEVSSFEGELFRLQFRPDAAFWKATLHDPNELITDAELGFRNGAQGLFMRKLPDALLHEREITQGRIQENGAAYTSCPPVLAVRAPDPQWLAALRRRYAVGGTRVLIDVTPMPACEQDRGFYDRHFASGMIDNTLGTLPLEMYTNSGRLHTTDAGAEEISRRIAEQIAEQMVRAEGSGR